MDRLIPPPDEFGLPAPWWMFLGLLNLTFLLHLCFMRFVLGGSLIQAAALLSRPNPVRARLAEATARLLPTAFSFTITTGVAPLLFVQTLYGQFFYTSNILLGFKWLGILALLLAAFYAAYFVQGRLLRQSPPTPSDRDRRAAVAALLSAACVLLIAAVLTANAALMCQPERWWDVYTGRASAWSPAGRLAWRYLHTLAGAVAVAGVWIAVAARWRRSVSRAERAALVRSGLRSGAWASLAAAAASAVECFVQDASIAIAGRPGTVFAGGCAAGSGLALAAAGMMFRGAAHPDDRRWTYAAAGAWLGNLVADTVAREGLRLALLSRPRGDGKPLFDPADLVEYPQVAAVAAFAVLLIAGVGLIAVMLVWLRRAPASRSE